MMRRRSSVVEQVAGIARAQHARQVLCPARGGDQVGGVVGDLPVLALAPEQRTQSCQLAR